MAIVQSGTEIWTYADAVDALCDAHAVLRTGLNERHARSSVRFAYRDFPLRHPWSYYYRQRVLQTVASYSTGTVVYDNSGGSNERMLTLTTGTWPTWAEYGRVVIDDVHYEVEYRVSDSIVTLAEYSNPGADVASTTYEIYRSSYPLPVNFGVIERLWDVNGNYEIPFVDQRTQHTALQAFYDTPSTPIHATIRATGKYLSGVELVFGPPPNAVLTYDMLYRTFPRPLAIDEYSSGTVTITSGTAAVTGTNTTFPATCAGSIIRFSTGIVKPSGYLGAIDGADNPYVYQAVIKSRGSATALTLEEVMPTTIATLTGVGYTISDPLDIDIQRMLTPLQRMAEAEFSRLASRQDAMMKLQLSRQSLLQAMEGDELVINHTGQVISSSIRRATVSNSA
jgi:hypothetical protein